MSGPSLGVVVARHARTGDPNHRCFNFAPSATCPFVQRVPDWEDGGKMKHPGHTFAAERTRAETIANWTPEQLARRPASKSSARRRRVSTCAPRRRQRRRRTGKRARQRARRRSARSPLLKSSARPRPKPSAGTASRGFCLRVAGGLSREEGGDQKSQRDGRQRRVDGRRGEQVQNGRRALRPRLGQGRGRRRHARPQAVQRVLGGQGLRASRTTPAS